MQAAADFVVEELVNETVPSDQCFAFERTAHNGNLEVRLRRGGDAVHRALVDDLEDDRGEPFAQLSFDLLLDTHIVIFSRGTGPCPIGPPAFASAPCYPAHHAEHGSAERACRK